MKTRDTLKQTLRMMGFMRPFLLTYIPGLILYSSQSFGFSLISAASLSWITAAALAADVQGVLLAIVRFVGLYVVYIVAVGLGTSLYVSTTYKAEKSLKTRLFRRFVGASVEGAAEAHSGEGIATFNTDANEASNLHSNSLSQLLVCVIAIVLSLIVVFAVDYRLGLVSVAIGLLSFFVQAGFSKPLGEIGEKTLESNAASVKAMSNIFAGAAVIRAGSLQDKAFAGLEEQSLKMLALGYRKAAISVWQSLFTTIQGWLTLAGVFAMGGYLVATGQLSFPALMMAPSMCQAIASGMSGIGGAWAAMQGPAAASRRIFALLDSAPSESHASAESVSPQGCGIKVRSLTFSYQSATAPALVDVNLDVEEKQMVAFVGESGSGKSTLLRAIIGMYQRSGMDISVGNMSFGSCGIHAWRGRFAYVDQSCKLFDMSIAENIALGLGKTPAQLPEGAIACAAKAAGAHSFIEALPQGYDTSCGEKGGSLSGGQKQRVAIARALLRGAPVLVFDEATASLDAESEKLVMETVESLRPGRTILIVTHNLSNVVTADKIVVMDKGRIVEEGRHQELMDLNGHYRRLYMQNQKKLGQTACDVAEERI